MFVIGCSSNNLNGNTIQGTPEISILKMNGEEKICYEDGYLKFVLENTNIVSITKFEIKTDGKYPSTTDVITNIQPNTAKDYNIRIKKIEEIKNIEFVPYYQKSFGESKTYRLLPCKN